MDFLGIRYGSFTAAEDNTESVNTTQNLLRVVVSNGARRYRLSISLQPDYKKGYGGKMSAHRAAFGLGKSFPVIMPQWISPHSNLLSRINADPDLQGIGLARTEAAGSTIILANVPANLQADLILALPGRYITISGNELRASYPFTTGKIQQILSVIGSGGTSLLITLCQPIAFTASGSYTIRFNPYIQVYYESVVALSTEMQANKLVRTTLELVEAL